jgi:glyoxylase-like metal-dependent hydrolase (beta-lactamase superfamily II)
LQALGLNAEDITDVVLTHLHFDHAGNVVRHKKTGPELGFPRATHHVQRRHLKWAEHASERDRVSFRDQDLQLLAKSGRLHLLDGDTEIFEGVDVLVSEGHTIGQQLLRVRGDDRVLLYCADVIPTTAHLPLAWVMGYDLYPLTTVEEKKTILAQALEEDWILAFEHDPRVLACSLQEQNGRVLPKDVIDL